jgi:transcription termination/antitermination protein NusA
MRSEFQTAVRQLIHEKGLPEHKVMEAVATALLAAYHKSYEGVEDVRIEVDADGEVKIWTNKRIVAVVDESSHEISLADAQLIKPHAALGEHIEVETPEIFNKIPAQAAKQVVLQRIREAELDYQMESFKDKLDELVLATVLRREHETGSYVLDLGNKAEGLLEPKEQIPGERLAINQRVRVYVMQIKPRRPQQPTPMALCSRIHKNIIRRLLELEVPEVHDGLVEIKAIAREPGSRSKVAVWARQESIDPIGACIGVRGNRINNIINELNGEKIDIIQWSADPAQFVANALSPVKPLNVELRQSDTTALVTVADRQLSLAIGKEGQNARLAARLTGWRIDVVRPPAGVSQDGE